MKASERACQGFCLRKDLPEDETLRRPGCGSWASFATFCILILLLVFGDGEGQPVITLPPSPPAGVFSVSISHSLSLPAPSTNRPRRPYLSPHPNPHPNPNPKPPLISFISHFSPYLFCTPPSHPPNLLHTPPAPPHPTPNQDLPGSRSRRIFQTGSSSSW